MVDGFGKATRYGYNADFGLTSVTQPEGNSTKYTFDTRGNVTTIVRDGKTGSSATDTVGSATYPATCDSTNFRMRNKPLTVTNARGAVTAFTYDAAHGGV